MREDPYGNIRNILFMSVGLWLVVVVVVICFF